MKNSPRKNKNTDNIDLLIGYDEFQDAVKEIRKTLQIPEDGFVNDEDIKKWTENAYIKSDEILESKKLKDQRIKINKELQSKKINKEEADKKWKEILNTIPWNYFTNAVKNLIITFHLPKHYDYFLRGYITTNNKKYPMNGFTITPSKDRKTVQVNVHMRLTNQDLREIKEEVNQYFGENLPHAQNIKDLPKKLEIENMYKNKEVLEEVTREKHKINDADIAETAYGDRKKKGSVRSTVQNLKSMRRRRFSGE